MNFTAIISTIIFVAAWVVGADFIISAYIFVAAWVVVFGALTTIAIMVGGITHVIDPAKSR